MNQCAYQYGTCTSLLHLFWGLVAPLPDIFPYTPPVPTLPGEHLSILQCPIPTPPPPLSSLCGHKLPNFRELTKMDKTSEDRINHHILNSALIVTMESDLPSRFYHIWSLSSLVHSAPAALYCSNEFVILTFCKTIYFWRAEKEHSANVWVPPVAMLSLMLSLPPWNAFSSYLFSVNWTCIFFQGQLKSLDTFLNPLNRINCSPSVLPQNFILPAPLVPSHDPGEYKDHVSLTALPPPSSLYSVTSLWFCRGGEKIFFWNKPLLIRRMLRGIKPLSTQQRLISILSSEAWSLGAIVEGTSGNRDIT